MELTSVVRLDFVGVDRIADRTLTGEHHYGLHPIGAYLGYFAVPASVTPGHELNALTLLVDWIAFVVLGALRFILWRSRLRFALFHQRGQLIGALCLVLFLLLSGFGYALWQSLGIFLTLRPLDERIFAAG